MLAVSRKIISVDSDSFTRKIDKEPGPLQPPALFVRALLSLKSDVRPEGDSEIVVSSIVEVDLISNIQAKPDWPQESLATTAGIQHAVHIVIAKALHAAAERGESSGTRIEPEVHESALDCEEEPHGAATCLHFRPEQSVQYAQVRPLGRDRTDPGVRETFPESLLEVPSDFAFQL